MPRVVAIGAQDFAELRKNKCFYIDKTDFIREWWKSQDIVTLITRPRRFGKTLNMSMLDCFFSLKYAGKGDELFSGLSVWEDGEMREQQGAWPVIFLSFAGVKAPNIQSAKRKIYFILSNLFSDYAYLTESDSLLDNEKNFFQYVHPRMDEDDAVMALGQLSRMLEKVYGRKAIIFLDEYDTPLQESYVYGYWEEMTEFMRPLFNNTFKTNPGLGRAVLTGVTRVSRESMFSDLNNLTVVSTTSPVYETAFGFTEEEVFQAMDEFGLGNREEVKDWYDGFTFGGVSDIYNPWSITNFLKRGKVGAYWANTSSNGLASKLIRQGSRELQEQFEVLLSGGEMAAEIREDVVFGELSAKAGAVWSLLLAAGYLRVCSVEGEVYRLRLTNRETRESFEDMVVRWFDGSGGTYDDFKHALLSGDVRRMNEYMETVALTTVSSFDSGIRPSHARPERFWHGLVLGLTVDLRDRYLIRSNRESGYGRCDVMMIPRSFVEGNSGNPAGRIMPSDGEAPSHPIAAFPNGDTSSHPFSVSPNGDASSHPFSVSLNGKVPSHSFAGSSDGGTLSYSIAGSPYGETLSNPVVVSASNGDMPHAENRCGKDGAFIPSDWSVPRKSAGRHPVDPAIIMEFKVLDEEAGEKSLSETAGAALRQIEERHYETELLDMGIAPGRIRKYGFAFHGKEVKIVEG